VTDGVPALISYVDREERYGFCNSAYKKWFGCPVEQLRGRTLREVLGEAAYAVVEPYVRAVLGGQAVSYDALLPYKDGGQRWVHAAYTPDHDEDGQVRGYFAIIADVTPHKQAEQTLREHAHTLNILNRLSNSLSGELDLDTVVQMVADAGTELSGARFGAFLRLEPDAAPAGFRGATR
jgi:PAS domain S-box-containing protein